MTVSFLIAAPQVIADAASDLTNIGSVIGSATHAAAAATTGVLPAAADEVSMQIASLFSTHAAEYQQLSAQATAFHVGFVEALTAGAGAYAAAEADVVQTLACAVPGLDACWGGGVAGLEASLGGALSGGLGGSLGAGLCGLGGSLSGVLQTGATLSATMCVGMPGNLAGGVLAAVGSVFGISPSLGVNMITGLSGLGAQLNGALTGAITVGLPGLPTVLAHAAAPFQALLTAGSPAAFMTQLQTMETGFNSALINGQLGFNSALVTQEAALETAAFGGVGAYNGVLDDVFNFWNSVLGTGEIGFDSLVGAQFPAIGLDACNDPWASFVGGLYVPGSFAIGGHGGINGLLGALDQKFLFDLNTVGFVTGELTGFGALPTAVATGLGAVGLQAPLSGFVGAAAAAGLPTSLQAALAVPVIGLDNLAGPQAHFIDNLVAAEAGFNTNLVAHELGLESALFGSTTALNGAVNHVFNAGNLVLGTGEQAVNDLLGAFPAPGVSTMLTESGAGAGVVSLGNFGGIEGIFNQTLAAGADLASLL